MEARLRGIVSSPLKGELGGDKERPTAERASLIMGRRHSSPKRLWRYISSQYSASTDYRIRYAFPTAQPRLSHIVTWCWH